MNSNSDNIPPLKIAETKTDLPKDTDLECPVCLNNVDLDGLDNYTPNCVICDNGHRMHFNCLRSSSNHECPVCRNKHMQFCKSKDGYFYAERKGGKKTKYTNKRGRKTYKKRKTNNKRKMNKRRKTNKK